MTSKRKLEIELTIEFLKRMVVEQKLIDDFTAMADSADNKKKSVKEIFINTISEIQDNTLIKKILTAYKHEFLSGNDPQIRIAIEAVLIVLVTERAKEIYDKTFILRMDDLIAVEVEMVLDKKFTENYEYKYNKKNSSIYCLIGLIHYLIELGYFYIDKDDPDASIRKVLEYLKERWHVKSLREFYRKKNKDKYKDLARLEFPVIERLERKRKVFA